MNFPKPVKPPSSIYKERSLRKKNLIRSSIIGVGLRLVIIAIEMAGVLMFDSSSIFLDALASLMDVASSIVLIYSIKLAARPPDKNHPFGHGRFEPLAGLQLALILGIVGAFMLFQQGTAIFNLSDVKPISPWAWTIPVAATITLEVFYRYLSKVARDNKSTALMADARHFRADALTSFVASVALIFGAFNPYLSIIVDHIGAIFIALIMIYLGYKAARENVAELTDQSPDSKYFRKVISLASNVPGVLGVEKVKIQIYGPDANVDIDVEVAPDLTVKKAHEISQNVRAEIQKGWSKVRDVIVHIEPYYPNDH